MACRSHPLAAAAAIMHYYPVVKYSVIFPDILSHDLHIYFQIAVPI